MTPEDAESASQFTMHIKRRLDEITAEAIASKPPPMPLTKESVVHIFEKNPVLEPLLRTPTRMADYTAEQREALRDSFSLLVVEHARSLQEFRDIQKWGAKKKWIDLALSPNPKRIRVRSSMMDYLCFERLENASSTVIGEEHKQIMI